MWVLLFKIRAYNLCLVSGTLSLLTFDVICDMVEIRYAKLLFGFCLFPLLPVPLFFIFCLLLDYLNIV